MEKNVLIGMINSNLSQRQIAVELSCSQSTVRYYLNKWNLKTKSANKKTEIHCRRCGEKDLKKMRSGCKYICKQCDTERTLKRFREYKVNAVEYKGGKCKACGYDSCNAALDFHHLDPSKKDPDWKKMRNRSFEKIKDELDKCVLLCNRCHVEVHQGIIEL